MRAAPPSDFSGPGAECLETDDSDTIATDGESPVELRPEAPGVRQRLEQLTSD